MPADDNHSVGLCCLHARLDLLWPNLCAIWSCVLACPLGNPKSRGPWRRGSGFRPVGFPGQA